MRFNFKWIPIGIIASLALNCHSANAFLAKFGIGPDNNKRLLTSFLNSATRTIQLNAYEFDSADFSRILQNKIREGVSVELLVEGQPVGKISKNSRETLSQLEKTMAQYPETKSHLYIMTKTQDTDKRRFRFDHAKYAVVDAQRAFVSSENLTLTGHPDAGDIGNRGWDTVLDSEEIASKLSKIFQEDIDPSYGDIQDHISFQRSGQGPSLEPGFNTFDLLFSSFILPEALSRFFSPTGKGARLHSRDLPIQIFSEGSGEVDSAHLILSPKSLEDLLRVIRSAKRSIRLEKMSLPLQWVRGGSLLNPIVSELIQAARRNVNVQVLLNDDQVFASLSQPKGVFFRFSENESSSLLRGNALTVDHLQTIARMEKLPLQAKIIDVQAAGITYIHNKGIIVDQEGVLISSINGTQNSITNNREVAVYLKSSDAAKYFGSVFDFDWQSSLGE